MIIENRLSDPKNYLSQYFTVTMKYSLCKYSMTLVNDDPGRTNFVSGKDVDAYFSTSTGRIELYQTKIGTAKVRVKIRTES